jgi:alpha-N-arabinofuranosidase
MKMAAKIFFLLSIVSGLAFSQTTMNEPKNKLIVHADAGKNTISRHIYGQFSEHLGRGIYEGIWVGENSPIPNTRGIRNDVVAALKKIKVPNLRWPGGCFADEYHWRDGIGPREQRPKMMNTNWGGVTEDNSFGTHEFMDLCEQLGAEPVICGNIGSGTVKEMSDWVQYLTSAGNTPMAELRKKNGRERPWKVKFWGVGNETWGCGGIMSAEHYANESARYSFFLKNYSGNTLYKIVSGGLPEDYNWTEAIMKKWSKTDGWLQGYMSGYSLHFYTVIDWSKKGSATNFIENEWFATLAKTIQMEELITKHAAVMDKYDPQKRIGLIVDEWGTWFEVEPGTNPSFLYQQNTMRDAMVAALNFNIFHQHCARVKMANIAQTVNVLQAMILTDNEKMILTPTYHVFDLYKVHQDALFLPSELMTEDYEHNGQKIPALNVSSSKAQDGSINLSMVNVHPVKNIALECEIKGMSAKQVSGMVLTAKALNAHNTFDQPDNVKIADFNKASLSNNVLKVEMPAKSVVVLTLK